MKICILGATGNSGRRLVRAALADGHGVTALVRDAGKMSGAADANLAVHSVPFDDEGRLAETMRGHDAVINAAGYVTDGPAYVELVQRIIRAASAALGEGGRFWLFGGAALLDVPGTAITTLDLPGVPKIFEAHRADYAAVRATSLDWSMLCPGPMIDAPAGVASDALVVSVEQWPVPRPGLTYVLPRIALSLAFKNAVPRMTIYYEDAAKVMLENLDRNGPLSRKRVGVALAHGETRHKRA